MSDFQADYKGIGELLRSDMLMFAMVERARKAETFARSIAPVDPDSPHKGRYRASFQVKSGKDGGAKHDRAFAELENFSPEAFYVEHGTKNNPAHHVLARALDVIGS